MTDERKKEVEQKQIEIDGLHKIMDENAGDKLALARLREEHAAEINSMNKEFDGVKFVVTKLFWNKVAKLQRQNDLIQSRNEEEKNQGGAEVEKNLKARIQ